MRQASKIKEFPLKARSEPPLLHLPDHEPEREDVRFLICAAAREDLWGSVGGRPSARAGEGGLETFGQADVGELGHVVSGDENIERLYLMRGGGGQADGCGRIQVSGLRGLGSFRRTERLRGSGERSAGGGYISAC